MTEQIADTVYFKDRKHELALARGTGWIDPSQFGLVPTEIHTACIRGFYMEYSVVDNHLLLTKMNVKDENENYPPINGIEATIEYNDPYTQDWELERSYEGLRILVPFSGGFIIARGKVRDEYLNPFHLHPMSFTIVRELRIDNGTITRMIDHSENVAQLRRKMDGQSSEPEDLMGWINDMFSLDYFI